MVNVKGYLALDSAQSCGLEARLGLRAPLMFSFRLYSKKGRLAQQFLCQMIPVWPSQSHPLFRLFLLTRRVQGMVIRAYGESAVLVDA